MCFTQIVKYEIVADHNASAPTKASLWATLHARTRFCELYWIIFHDSILYNYMCANISIYVKEESFNNIYHLRLFFSKYNMQSSKFYNLQFLQ